MTFLSNYFRWDVVLLFVLFAAIFALEMLGIFVPHFVSITYIVRGMIPRWARWMILGWLMYHFGVE